jgi:uncharacterized membrane protein
LILSGITFQAVHQRFQQVVLVAAAIQLTVFLYQLGAQAFQLLLAGQDLSFYGFVLLYKVLQFVLLIAQFVFGFQFLSR